MEMLPILLVFWFCFCIPLLRGDESSDIIYPQSGDLECHVFNQQQHPHPHLPSFHFRPPKNWLNDPNGPMWYKGVYHLFYQYNPDGAQFSDRMVWAHSVSHDMINWVDLPLALIPTQQSDFKSCWSGSTTILPGNRPLILYTGIDANGIQVQNLASPQNMSDPFLEQWHKSPRNPVMTPPQGVPHDYFRDPTTAWQDPDGKWNVIVGGMIGDDGMAILYQCLDDDFVTWTKVDHPLYSSPGTGMWECPDFFPVSVNGSNGVDTSVVNPSVKHVLKLSSFVHLHDYYMIGAYAPELSKYVPEIEYTGKSRDLRYDYGKFYASKTFFDKPKSRRILWGWLNESDSSEDDIAKGWAGVQSIPREVWLHKSGKQLMQWPIEELNKLRGDHVRVMNQKLDGGSVFEVEGITTSQVNYNDMADVEIVFELGSLKEAESLDTTHETDPQRICSDVNASTRGKLGPFGLLVLATKELTEHTAIYFRVFKGNDRHVVLMCSDQRRSSLSDGIDKTPYGAFLDIDPQHEKLSLRSLIDHSIVESFGGEGKSCISCRVYPKLAINSEAHLFVFNNGTVDVTIKSMNAWSMNSAGHKSDNRSYAALD
ncbi:Beta-fructofuranosidase, insoluble isoenzyme CWINV3 [Linum perenne]